MASNIKKVFSKDLPIKITLERLKTLIKIVRTYELRDKHPIVLNGPYVGIHSFYHYANDRDVIFNLFNYTERQVSYVVQTIPTINKEYNVISNPFNQFCLWILYNIKSSSPSSISKKIQEEAFIALANYFQYRFFSSTTNNFFKFGAREDVMAQVIEDLSYKFDIKTEETWIRVFTKRSSELLIKGTRHFRVFETYDNDSEINFTITNIQTKIRSQIRIIANLYYEYVDRHRKIESSNLTVDVDGEIIIQDPKASTDIMIYGVLNQLKVGRINERYLIILNAMYSSLSTNLIVNSIIAYKQEYLRQSKKSKVLKKVLYVKKPYYNNAKEEYIGIYILMEKLIKLTIYSCIKNKVNMNNKISIFKHMQNVLSASRSTEVIVFNLKESVRNFLIRSDVTKRETTLSSLIIAVLLYFVLAGLEITTRHTDT